MVKNFSQKRDVYIEIAERYENYMTLGVIKSGEKLPSVRSVATELRVNPNTVQKAYSLLEEKGLIRLMPKKGAFVIFGNEGKENKDDFDALTDYELFSKMVGYVKKLDAFVKNELEDALTKYIDERFNDILLDTMYDPDTETLIMYINRGENNG